MSALAHRDFRIYQWARLCSILGQQMQGVAVGWQVYALTDRALDLGLVGLAQFVPFILCAIPGGHVADRFDRRGVLVTCYAVQALCSAALATYAFGPWRSPWPIYAALAVLGATRAFSAPAASALTPHLVPVEHFPNAIAWASSARQVAVLVGPAVGGLLYAAFNHAGVVYVSSAAASVAAALFGLRIAVRTGRSEAKGISWETVLAGFRFVLQRRLLLGSMSLDLFAVLLGGAVALLPIYARDVLHTGPWGLGLLRSAPAVGAGAMAFWVAHHPLERRAGATMLWCVALFGVATVVFGVSESFVLSLGMLVVMGATDMVSVVVRLTLEQIDTPAPMRGRVSAVNMMFIGASNELGEFESGVTAAWLGAVRAVVLGGLGTVAVVGLWSLLFPELRRVERLAPASTG